MSAAYDVGRPKQVGVAGLPWSKTPAHIVRSDEEALEIAARLAEDFAAEAAQRDRHRSLPVKEIEAFSQSGLWGINVPRRFGGAEVSYATLARVIAIISAADPSIGQIPQNHLGVVAAVRTVSDEAQQELLFGEILRGLRFGNAFSEF